MTDFDNNNGVSSNVASVAQAFHFFSGLERPEGVSVTFRGLGGKAVDIDSRIDARGMDLVIPSVRSDMRARVSAAHRPRLMLDPPCHTYSVGRYRHGSGRVLRRWVNGVVTIADGLSPHELEQLRVADVLRDITLGLAELACRAGGSFIIENPVHRGGDDISNPWFQAKWGDHVSWWCHPDVQAFATRMNAQWVTFPQCALGGKFQKLTTFLLSPDLSHLASFLGGLQCRHRHHDSVARGWSEGGEALGDESACFPPRLCRVIAVGLFNADDKDSLMSPSERSAVALQLDDVHLQHERHLLKTLTSMREGPAVLRAELDRSSTGDTSVHSIAHLIPEKPTVVRRLPLLSVDLENASVEPRDHWASRRFTAGVDWDWRPEGGAAGLFLDPQDWLDMEAWVVKATVALNQMLRGEPYDAPPNLHIPVERLCPQARAAAPWATSGEFADEPVPVAMLMLTSPEADSDAGVSRSFYRRMKENGDPDVDIIDEWLNGGIEDESAAMDILLTFHHDTCVDFLQEFTAGMDIEFKEGCIAHRPGVPSGTLPKLTYGKYHQVVLLVPKLTFPEIITSIRSILEV